MTTDTLDLRRRRHDQDGRLRHGQRGRRARSTSSPASARRTSRSSSCTTASPPTSCSPTRRSACPRRATPRSSSGTATTPTAARSSPTRRAACCPRATRSAPPASPSAPSWCGSCAAQAGARQVEGARIALQHNLGLGGAASSRSTRRRLMRVDRDARHRRTSFPPSSACVERGRLRLFAKAIGETDPVYTDVAGRTRRRPPGPAGAADLLLQPRAASTRPVRATSTTSASTCAASCTASSVHLPRDRPTPGDTADTAARPSPTSTPRRAARWSSSSRDTRRHRATAPPVADLRARRRRARTRR